MSYYPRDKQDTIQYSTLCDIFLYPPKAKKGWQGFVLEGTNGMNHSPPPPPARHAHCTLPVLHGSSVLAGPVFTVLPVFSCVPGTGHNSVTCVPGTVLPVFLVLGTAVLPVFLVQCYLCSWYWAQQCYLCSWYSVTCVPGTGHNNVTCVPGIVLPVLLVMGTTVLSVFLV